MIDQNGSVVLGSVRHSRFAAHLQYVGPMRASLSEHHLVNQRLNKHYGQDGIFLIN